MLPWVPEGFFFRNKAAIVSGEAANPAKREKKIFRWQDHDRGFAAHNRSFATKKKPSGNQGMRLRAKSKNFQGLVFTPNRDKLLLWALRL